MGGCIIGAGCGVGIRYTISLLKARVMSFLRIARGTNAEGTWELCR